MDYPATDSSKNKRCDIGASMFPCFVYSVNQDIDCQGNTDIYDPVQASREYLHFHRRYTANKQLNSPQNNGEFNRGF